MMHCTICEWMSSSNGGHIDSESGKQAIDHYIDTGHRVESVDEIRTRSTVDRDGQQPKTHSV